MIPARTRYDPAGRRPRGSSGNSNPQERSIPTLGPQIEEGNGKRTGRRVIATEPEPKFEATAEETQKLLGIEGLAIITYTASLKPDAAGRCTFRCSRL